MPQAQLYVPPRVPRLSVAGLMRLLAAVRKAWVVVSPLVPETPTTWPEALMPQGTGDVPPSVPRSIIVYVGGGV